MEDDEEDEGLSLQRFESGAAQPPRLINDEEGSDEDEDEPRSPPPLTDEELAALTGGAGDDELAGIYHHIAECPCHGEKPPAAGKVWGIPRKPGEEGGRRAVVQVMS